MYPFATWQKRPRNKQETRILAFCGMILEYVQIERENTAVDEKLCSSSIDGRNRFKEWFLESEMSPEKRCRYLFLDASANLFLMFLPVRFLFGRWWRREEDERYDG